MLVLFFLTSFLRDFASPLTEIPRRLALPITAFRVIPPPIFLAMSRALTPACQNSLSFAMFSGVHS